MRDSADDEGSGEEKGGSKGGGRCSCVVSQPTNVGQDAKGLRVESEADSCGISGGEDSAGGTGGGLLAPGFGKRAMRSISEVDSMSVDSMSADSRF